MYTVLIVDDEEPVLDSYSYMLEKDAEGYMLAGKARTGFEAIQLLYELKPDVVFMDINMPGIDGLETIARVHDSFPHTVFILSTAYERFDLAKRAIPLGIHAYLVKPVTRRLFLDTLENLRPVLARRAAQPLSQDRDRVAVDFLNSRIWNEFDDTEWLSVRRELELDSDIGCIVFISLDADSTNRFQVINEFLSLKYRYFFTRYLDLGMYFFPGELNRQVLESSFSEIIASSLSDPRSASFAIGPQASGRALHGSCLEAFDTVRRKRNQSSALLRERLLIIRLRRDIGIAAHDEVRAIFDSLWQEVFAVWEFPLAKARMISVMTLILEDCCQYYRSYEDITVPLDPAAEITAVQSVEQWRNWAQYAFSSLYDMAWRNRSEKLPAPLVKALHFIGIHLSDQIQLSDVADAAQISPVYLSRIFSEHMGMNFSEYVSVSRIEHAEKLIGEGNMSIKEVAFAVGYQDPNYFGKCFKKIVGVSPSMYAQRFRDEKSQ